MDKLILGRYVPGKSLIHHLDPRSKLLAMILYIVIVFWANNVVTNIIMVAFTLIVVLLSKIKLSFFLKRCSANDWYYFIHGFVSNVFYTRWSNLFSICFS